MASTTLEEVLGAVREAGSEGIEPEKLVEQLEAAKSTVTRFTNVLLDDGLIRRNGDKVYPVLRKGRRLVSTLERDEKVYLLVEDAGENGLSVGDAADQLGIEPGLAYLSIYRLQRFGRIYRVGVTRTARWRAFPPRAA